MAVIPPDSERAPPRERPRYVIFYHCGGLLRLRGRGYPFSIGQPRQAPQAIPGRAAQQRGQRIARGSATLIPHCPHLRTSQEEGSWVDTSFASPTVFIIESILNLTRGAAVG